MFLKFLVGLFQEAVRLQRPLTRASRLPRFGDGRQCVRARDPASGVVIAGRNGFSFSDRRPHPGSTGPGFVTRVSEFAAFLKRSPEYLSRTAASIVGVPLRVYLRKKQLEEAERLITRTPLPMHEIALHAGFGTTSTFYRCFKQAHGMPPGEFREVTK